MECMRGVAFRPDAGPGATGRSVPAGARRAKPGFQAHWMSVIHEAGSGSRFPKGKRLQPAVRGGFRTPQEVLPGVYGVLLGVYGLLKGPSIRWTFVQTRCRDCGARRERN